MGFMAEDPSPVRSIPHALELVEDAVVLVQGAQFASQVVVNLEDTMKIQTTGWTLAAPFHCRPEVAAMLLPY